MNAHEAKHKLQVVRTLLGTGMIQPVRPDKAVRSIRALRRWGPTPAAAPGTAHTLSTMLGHRERDRR